MFKSIFKAYKAIYKAGVKSLDAQTSPNVYNLLQDETNGDPLCDQLGNQWVRDADLPVPFSDENNVYSPAYAFAIFSKWTRVYGSAGMIVGINNAYSGPVGLYAVHAISGDPTVAWSADPIYLQGFTQAAMPIAGQVPDFSIPVPPPPLMGSFQPGVRTPFQGQTGLALYFSSTEATYTAGPTGTIIANWANYSGV